MIAGLLFALVLTDPAAPPPRAELCLAHVNALIAESQRETGMVAGPSWYIRSWWTARLPGEGSSEALTGEQRAALDASMPGRKAADPDAYRTELRACVAEAIEGGALP
jgi:hypothetical protein